MSNIDPKIVNWLIPGAAVTVKGDVPGHEFHGNQYTGGGGSGDGSEGGDGGNGGGSSGGDGGSEGSLSSGSVPSGGNDLKWSSEDTISGSVVVETESADASGISEDNARSYIKKNLSDLVPMLRGPEDIEDVKIKKLEHGKGYVRIHIDATPTVEAGENWIAEGSPMTQSEVH